ncbi:GSU3473 family protein [Geopsychrobacter electrodiphilus]|uniref:GSU3473 family protein n=1 Tax=Geopsychrobacter electrodiphilus TaxID=225196 RepID=UPI000369FEF3|nr:hypothetical protein [Geopsychrobacter electrodiphilus]
MLVPVVLKNWLECSVRKDELQYLIVTEKVMFFERSDGWAVLGRDKMRHLVMPFEGEERRQHQVFAKDN